MLTEIYRKQVLYPIFTILMLYIMESGGGGKDTPIDWKEITKSNKGVRTNDQQTCGNVIAEDGNSIIISEGLINRHEFMVPKSKVDYYDGSEVHLNLSYDILSAVFKIKSK